MALLTLAAMLPFPFLALIIMETRHSIEEESDVLVRPMLSDKDMPDQQNTL